MQKITLYLIGVTAAVLLGWVEPSFSQECPESEPEGEFQDIQACITLDSGLGVGADDVDGDGIPDEYCHSNRNKITARVGRNSNIVLEVGEASARTLFLDLSEALTCACSTKIDIEGAPDDDTCDASTVCLDDVPIPTDVSDARFVISLGADLDDLALDCTHEDNATLTFAFGEDTWVLRWGPYESAGGAGQCPGSDPVVVTRFSDNEWSFETTGEHLACLYRQENPPHTAKEYHGQFVVPFSGMATALDEQTVNLTPCIAQECRDRRDRLAVPAECSVIGPCGACGDQICDPGEDECNCPADCAGVPPPPEGDCADGVDNDCDGLIDCDDVDCSADSACAVCGDGDCGPGEDQCNCPSDCGDPPISEANCTDGIDEDCDGFTDCDDGDCDADPACQPTGCDNDGVCEPGEDCENCPNDCDSKTNGPPSGRYCCGNGIVEGPEGDDTICDGNP